MASYRYPRYMRSYRRGNTPLGCLGPQLHIVAFVDQRRVLPGIVAIGRLAVEDVFQPRETAFLVRDYRGGMLGLHHEIGPRAKACRRYQRLPGGGDFGLKLGNPGFGFEPFTGEGAEGWHSLVNLAAFVVVRHSAKRDRGMMCGVFNLLQLFHIFQCQFGHGVFSPGCDRRAAARSNQ